MKSRRIIQDIPDVSEMDPWQDDRCRDFVALNTIQRLRAYHLPVDEPMPPVEPINAVRATNLLLLPRARPDYRPCCGETANVSRSSACVATTDPPTAVPSSSLLMRKRNSENDDNEEEEKQEKGRMEGEDEMQNLENGQQTRKTEGMPSLLSIAKQESEQEDPNANQVTPPCIKKEDGSALSCAAGIVSPLLLEEQRSKTLSTSTVAGMSAEENASSTPLRLPTLTSGGEQVRAACTLDRARRVFFGHTSFASSTSPRQMLHSPHVPLTPSGTPTHSSSVSSVIHHSSNNQGTATPIKATSAPGDETQGQQQAETPIATRHSADGDGRTAEEERQEVTPSRVLFGATPLRGGPWTTPTNLHGSTQVAGGGSPPSRDVMEGEASHGALADQSPRRTTLHGSQELDASPPHRVPPSASFTGPQFSCDICEALIAYYQSLLTRGVVLDRFNHKDLAFAWWVIGKNMDTKALDHPGTMRRETLAMTIKDFYYSQLSSKRRSAVTTGNTAGLLSPTESNSDGVGNSVAAVFPGRSTPTPSSASSSSSSAALTTTTTALSTTTGGGGVELGEGGEPTTMRFGKRTRAGTTTSGEEDVQSSGRPSEKLPLSASKTDASVSGGRASSQREKKLKTEMAEKSIAASQAREAENGIDGVILGAQQTSESKKMASGTKRGKTAGVGKTSTLKSAVVVESPVDRRNNNTTTDLLPSREELAGGEADRGVARLHRKGVLSVSKSKVGKEGGGVQEEEEEEEEEESPSSSQTLQTANLKGRRYVSAEEKRKNVEETWQPVRSARLRNKGAVEAVAALAAAAVALPSPYSTSATVLSAGTPPSPFPPPPSSGKARQRADEGNGVAGNTTTKRTTTMTGVDGSGTGSGSQASTLSAAEESNNNHNNNNGDHNNDGLLLTTNEATSSSRTAGKAQRRRGGGSSSAADTTAVPASANGVAPTGRKRGRTATGVDVTHTDNNNNKNNNNSNNHNVKKNAGGQREVTTGHDGIGVAGGTTHDVALSSTVAGSLSIGSSNRRKNASAGGLSTRSAPDTSPTPSDEEAPVVIQGGGASLHATPSTAAGLTTTTVVTSSGKRGGGREGGGGGGGVGGGTRGATNDHVTCPPLSSTACSSTSLDTSSGGPTSVSVVAPSSALPIRKTFFEALVEQRVRHRLAGAGGRREKVTKLQMVPVKKKKGAVSHMGTLPSLSKKTSTAAGSATSNSSAREENKIGAVVTNLAGVAASSSVGRAQLTASNPALVHSSKGSVGVGMNLCGNRGQCAAVGSSGVMPVSLAKDWYATYAPPFLLSCPTATSYRYLLTSPIHASEITAHYRSMVPSLAAVDSEREVYGGVDSALMGSMYRHNQAELEAFITRCLEEQRYSATNTTQRVENDERDSVHFAMVSPAIPPDSHNVQDKEEIHHNQSLVLGPPSPLPPTAIHSGTTQENRSDTTKASLGTERVTTRGEMEQGEHDSNNDTNDRNAPKENPSASDGENSKRAVVKMEEEEESGREVSASPVKPLSAVTKADAAICEVCPTSSGEEGDDIERNPRRAVIPSTCNDNIAECPCGTVPPIVTPTLSRGTSRGRVDFHELPYAQQCLLVWEAANLLEHANGSLHRDNPSSGGCEEVPPVCWSRIDYWKEYRMNK